MGSLTPPPGEMRVWREAEGETEALQPVEREDPTRRR